MKIYRLKFADRDEAILIQTQIIMDGHTAVNMTGFGPQIITPGYEDEDGNLIDPIIDDSYFAMALTNEDELIADLESYVTDVAYFKPVYAGQVNDDYVVKPEDYGL